MAELRGDLSLETRDAERDIEGLGDIFERVVQGFSVELARALDQLTDVRSPNVDFSDVRAAAADVADDTGTQLALALETAGEEGAAGLASALDGTTEGVGDQLALALETGAQAGAGGVTGSIEQAVSGADTDVVLEPQGEQEITDAIETAISDADTTVPLDITGTGDLREASQEAEQASGGFERLAGSATIASGAFSAAQGGATSLRGALSGTNAAMALGTGIFAAGTAAVFSYFDAAVESEAASERFRRTLGDTANEVERLTSIEGLNTDLSTLALTLGSDDDSLRNVVSTLFEFVRGAGKSEEAASLFVQQAVALSARAIALNPSLGDLASVTEGLSNAFARGGRFAAKFQLDLAQEDIIARALNTTHKESAEQLTIVERAQAGAALAAEKYGRNLDRIVARGAENAEIKQRRLQQTLSETFEDLGRPLIAPIFELLEAGIPISEQFGRVIAQVARGVIPAFTAALRVAAPVLGFVADVLEQIPGPVIAVAAALLLLNRRASDTTSFLSALGGEGLTTSARFGRAAIGLGLFVTGLEQIDGTAKNTALGVGQLVASGALIGSAFGAPVLGAAIGGVVGLGKALFESGESADEFRKRISELRKELEGLNTDQSIRKFVDESAGGIDKLRRDIKLAAGDVRGSGLQMGAAVQSAGDRVKQFRTDFSELARQSPADAARVLQGLRQLRAENGKPLFPPEVIAKFEADLARQEQAFIRSNLRKRETQAENEALIQSEARLREAAAETAERAAEAWKGYVDTLQQNVPTITGVFEQAISDAQKVAEETETALDPEVVITKLEERTQGVKDFAENVNFFLGEGLDDLAALVVQKGPEAGGALAQAFADATPEVRRRAEEAIQAANLVITTFADSVAGPLAQQLRNSAIGAGFELGDGMAFGIRQSRPAAVAEAEATARAVEQAMLAELGISSPSKVAMDIGERIGEGLALGMDRSVERFVDPSGRRMAMRSVADAQSAPGSSSTVQHIDNSFHADGWQVQGGTAERTAAMSVARFRAWAAARAR